MKKILRKLSALALSFVLMFAALYFGNMDNVSTTTNAEPMQTCPAIIIDAGHGGLTNTIKV